MPRGSRPGERRGGRKPGTPNKKTLLKNAVFLAGAGGTTAEPKRSPLEFMLALMRDPQVALDDRIKLAAKAAPFVHARPEPMRKSSDLKFAKLEPKAAAANGGGGEGGVSDGGEDVGAVGSDGEGLSPLDFLLGVMADPAADSEQRVKAAAVAARYKHAIAAPDPEAPSIVVADKFGFKVEPELARAEREDRLREATLEATSHLRSKDSLSAKEAEQELEQIGKRRAERLARFSFPDAYAYADRQTDENRLAQLASKRASRKNLTAEEDAEEAHLAVRVLHPQAKPPAAADVISAGKYKMERPMKRMVELEQRAAGGETLTVAEDEELKDLRARHPEIAADVDELDHEYNYCFGREIVKGGMAGVNRSTLQAALDKCKPLRNPWKMIDLQELREGPRTRIHELESLRWDDLLTPEEADELEEWHRRYPEAAEKARKFVNRRLSQHQMNREANSRIGYKVAPIEQGEWPRIWTSPADNARSRTPERRPLDDDEFTPA